MKPHAEIFIDAETCIQTLCSGGFSERQARGWVVATKAALRQVTENRSPARRGECPYLADIPAELYTYDSKDYLRALADCGFSEEQARATLAAMDIVARGVAVVKESPNPPGFGVHG